MESRPPSTSIVPSLSTGIWIVLVVANVFLNSPAL